ncbi:unnamed protein product [Caenorhabditis auriculariae]|uniref:ubiquitinyl hydrolase 1 n=1 Tax=Caenorhabditis auriculariae TaxID=2777116 RepID=A0A8S1HEL6_9PELO|nr:unnamed protein product [Caenorhabditis auriculariae]
MTPYDITFAIIPFNFAQIELRYWLKVQAMDQEMNESQMILWPKKTEMVSNILELASQDFKFAANGTGKLRLLHVGISRSNRRVFGCFNDDTYATEIQQKLWNFSHTVRIEEIPHDQVYVGPSEVSGDQPEVLRYLIKRDSDLDPRQATDSGCCSLETARSATMTSTRAVRSTLAELGFQLGQSRSPFPHSPYLCLDHPKKQYQKSFEMSVEIRH